MSRLHAAPSRTPLGQWAETVSDLIGEQPVPRVKPCPYCGARTRGLACRAHEDLPELDRGVFRDFCSALREGGRQ